MIPNHYPCPPVNNDSIVYSQSETPVANSTRNLRDLCSGLEPNGLIELVTPVDFREKFYVDVVLVLKCEYLLVNTIIFNSLCPEVSYC